MKYILNHEDISEAIAEYILNHYLSKKSYIKTEVSYYKVEDELEVHVEVTYTED